MEVSEREAQGGACHGMGLFDGAVHLAQCESSEYHIFDVAVAENIF
jgi:hypothetical protein